MLGVCWYPEHWSEAWWEDDARAMGALGIRHVRIGEFSWSRIEPRRGELDWGWLDRAMDVLGRAGLRVVLGTPTATPPKWLVDSMPDMLPVGRDGRVRGFGSRRHYSFAHQGYRDACERIVLAMAERYGAHPALEGWQTDNEFGCHDTVRSYGPHDRAWLQEWLRRRYQDPAQLNEAWGAAFWSMELTSFAEVELPNLTVTEANPAHWLDYHRAASDAVLDFNAAQVDILRQHSPGRFITHNMMGFVREFDHWALGRQLDVASWDSYPLGFLERPTFEEAEKTRFTTVSHPDIAAFHHDLYRGVGRGRFWVMEQQPGPVNWAPWNPVPERGMVRLWTWEALAHGAEVVCYFRWRQAPFAQEQMHAGLNRPDRVLSPGGVEAGQVARELGQIALPASRPARVALVFDYEAAWILEVQPQGRDFTYEALTFRWYEAVRRFGLDVDIVPAGAPLDGYAAVLVPSLPYVSDAALAAFVNFEGVLLFGPRTGSKTRSFQIPAELPPGPIQELLPLKVTQVASLRPGRSEPASGAFGGRAVRWREWIETALPALSRFADGTPALVGDGRRFYLGAWPDAELLESTVRHLLGEVAGLALTPLGDELRMRRRGDLVFAFNYGAEPADVPLPTSATAVLGDGPVPPRGVSIWH